MGRQFGVISARQPQRRSVVFRLIIGANYPPIVLKKSDGRRGLRKPTYIDFRIGSGFEGYAAGASGKPIGIDAQ